MQVRVSPTRSWPIVLGLLVLQGCGGERFINPDPSLSRGSGSDTTPLSAADLPVVQSISISPSTVSAGATATGSITITAAAPAGGVSVGVLSNNVAVATVSSPVVVAEGSTTATFTITSHPVAAPDFAAISANVNGVTQTAVLNVTPSGTTLSTLTFSPTTIASGTTSTGTITLSGPAPAGGGTVTLSSADPSLASVPASVTVPAGATTATFAATAGAVQSFARVAITAAYGGVSRVTSLSVTAPPPTGAVLTNLTISPSVVVGGTNATGTATIASAVGTDTPVSLQSTDLTVATVPATITIPAGATSATFTVTTLVQPQSGVGTFSVIIGTAGGSTLSATITTTPPPTGPSIVSIEFFPSSVGGTGPATGKITLNGPATQGAQVQLTNSRPDIIQVPSSVVVSANTSVAWFPVTTVLVGANTPVSVTGNSCCGALGSATGTITVTTDAPPPPDVVSIQKADFKPGGRGSTLKVRAHSTSATAILTVFRDASTVPSFVLVNRGGGLYQGSFSFSGTAPSTVTVRSNLGGSATANVKR